MAPDKYAFGDNTTHIGSQGNYEVVTETFQIQDRHSSVKIPGAVVHFRATRGFSHLRPVWWRFQWPLDGCLELLYPIVHADTLFGCARILVSTAFRLGQSSASSLGPLREPSIEKRPSADGPQKQ